MFLIWVLQSFLNAIWIVLSKKVVENKKVWNNIQTFISRLAHAIFLIIIFLFWFLKFNISEDSINIFNILLLILATMWLYITYPLRRNAYANEKVSVLQPFAMLYQVFPIIIGFIFIASERVNIITFITAILASAVVILANINYKNFKINKWSLMVLVSSVIKSFQLFVVLYFLTFLSPASFYFIETVLILIFSALFIVFKWELWEVNLLTKKYLKLILWTSFIVISSILLSLSLYSILWVVATSLLSLLYLVFVYILSYFILKETPSKKDIAVTFIVAVCIIVGMYFKQ